jgi:hypothetical protein
MEKKLCLNGCGTEVTYKYFCSIECEVEHCDKMNNQRNIEEDVVEVGSN